MLKYWHVWRAELVCRGGGGGWSSKLQVKVKFTETCPPAAWWSVILSFQTGMDANLLSYVCLCVCVWGMGGGGGQWHSSVGQFQLRFSSGVPVYTASIHYWVAQWYPSVPWVNQWHSSVHWTSQCALAQGKGIDMLLQHSRRNTLVNVDYGIIFSFSKILTNGLLRVILGCN